MSDKKNVILSLPVVIAGSLFLILFFILTIHSRLASDDFYYLFLNNKFGAWKGMLYQYDRWSGRWAAHFLACYFLQFASSRFFVPVIEWATLILLFLSIRKGIGLINNFFQIDAAEKTTFGFALLLVAGFFFSTYNIGETWFWYIIIITYLWSIIALITLFNNIFSPKSNFFNYAFIVLSAAFIGGASESYALISIFQLGIIGLYRWKRMNKKFSEQASVKLLVALSVIIISLSFSALAPGTEIRYSLLPHLPFSEKIWVAIKAFVKFFVRYLPSKLPYLVLFSLPWLIFGSITGDTSFNKTRSRILMLNATILFLILLVILFIPTAVIMSETGPDRALSMISLSGVIYFAILFFLLGTQIRSEKNFLKILSYAGTITTILLIGFKIVDEFKTTATFENAYDERMKTIIENKQNNNIQILELPKLPPSGLLYWEELSTDTSYFVNQHVKAGFDLPFAVRLKEK